MLGGEEGPALPQSWWGWPQHPAGSPSTNAIICWWWRDWLAEGEHTSAAYSSFSPACSVLGGFQVAGLQEAQGLVLHPTGYDAERYN